MDKQEKSKGPGGRPTKYSDELQALADTYIFSYKDQGDVIPSRVGLCCFLGIAKSTSFEWADIYPEFSATLAAIDALQENVALNRGLDGTFNATIVKLVMANHGYSDKQELSHTSPDGSMATPTRIEIVAPNFDNTKDRNSP